MDTVADGKRVQGRRHSVELKSRVLTKCANSGASLVQVALSHGLNSNLVHKWPRQAQREAAAQCVAWVRESLK